MLKLIQKCLLHVWIVLPKVVGGKFNLLCVFNKIVGCYGWNSILATLPNSSCLPHKNELSPAECLWTSWTNFSCGEVWSLIRSHFLACITKVKRNWCSFIWKIHTIIPCFTLVSFAFAIVCRYITLFISVVDHLHCVPLSASCFSFWNKLVIVQ